MRNHIIIVCIACMLSLSFFQCAQDVPGDQPSGNDTTGTVKNGGFETPEKWGEHLVSFSGCTDCHTPKKMTDRGPIDDSTMFLAGHPANAPLPDVDRGELEKKGVVATRGMTEWLGPWGVSFAANLTPDSTGIGGWTEEQFLIAIKEGKYKGLRDARPLLPPMPWQGIRMMTDDELKAVFAYLKSLKPVKNTVPAALPPVTAAKR